VAPFIAAQRVNEIGIRKVLGESVFRIGHLLPLKFVILVFIAIPIALPGAYLLVHSWLENYQYRSEIS
jgi:hypothetical protein